MTPPVRRPARARAALRASLRTIRAEWATFLLCTVLAFIVVSMPELPAYQSVGLLFLLPGFYWRDALRPQETDAALPLPWRTHVLVRVAAGGACALLALVLAAASIAWNAATGGGSGDYPAWFAAAVVPTGLTAYLLGSTFALLGGVRKAATAFAVLASLLLVPQPRPWRAATAGMRTPAELADVAFAEWLALSTLLLAGACAAVWLAAGTRESGAHAAARAGRAADRLLPRGPRPAPGPRRPAPWSTVLGEHFRLWGPDMEVSLALLLFLTLRTVLRLLEPGATLDAALEPWALPVLGPLVGLTCVFLTVRDGSDAVRARPVGHAAQVLLQAGAGIVWTLLGSLAVVAAHVAAARAGGSLARVADAPPLLWAAIPAAALAWFLAATLVVLLAKAFGPAPALLGAVGFRLLTDALPGLGSLFLPGLADVFLSGAGSPPWSPDALLWLVPLSILLVIVVHVVTTAARRRPRAAHDALGDLGIVLGSPASLPRGSAGAR
ncbi:MAG TPA: hypothetical protein VFQ45_00145 [Longimicrobium sp.]|nr:hypothetical protein [Longimicrobium sp.]